MPAYRNGPEHGKPYTLAVAPLPYCQQLNLAI